MLGKQGRCVDNLCRLFDVGVITCRCHAGAMLVPSRCNVGAILPKPCRNSVPLARYRNATDTVWLRRQSKIRIWRPLDTAARTASHPHSPTIRSRLELRLKPAGAFPGVGHRRPVQKNARRRRSKWQSSTGTIRPSCRHPCQAPVRASDQPNRQPCLVASESADEKRRSALTRTISLSCCLNLHWRSVKPPRGWHAIGTGDLAVRDESGRADKKSATPSNGK
jgi:hypothetical protein